MKKDHRQSGEASEAGETHLGGFGFEFTLKSSKSVQAQTPLGQWNCSVWFVHFSMKLIFALLVSYSPLVWLWLQVEPEGHCSGFEYQYFQYPETDWTTVHIIWKACCKKESTNHPQAAGPCWDAEARIPSRKSAAQVQWSKGIFAHEQNSCKAVLVHRCAIPHDSTTNLPVWWFGQVVLRSVALAASLWDVLAVFTTSH